MTTPPAPDGRRRTLEGIVADIRDDLGEAHRAREVALPACRSTIRHAGLAIRAIHRGDADAHAEQVATSEAHLRTAQDALEGHPEVAHAGFLHDAEKEYAEARLCAAMVRGERLATPDELGVGAPAWMRGLAEAASELRRNALDRLRAGDLDAGEALLEVMDDVYDVLASVDLPDALTGGLRRTVDQLRAVTERTRGDITTTALQTRLQRAIESAGPTAD